jgi:hypothetical protein
MMSGPFNGDRIIESPTLKRVGHPTRSDEGESNVLRLRLAWDGCWTDDTESMKRHMTVRELPAT